EGISKPGASTSGLKLAISWHSFRHMKFPGLGAWLQVLGVGGELLRLPPPGGGYKKDGEVWAGPRGETLSWKNKKAWRIQDSEGQTLWKSESREEKPPGRGWQIQSGDSQEWRESCLEVTLEVEWWGMGETSESEQEPPRSGSAHCDLEVAVEEEEEAEEMEEDAEEQSLASACDAQAEPVPPKPKAGAEEEQEFVVEEEALVEWQDEAAAPEVPQQTGRERISGQLQRAGYVQGWVDEHGPVVGGCAHAPEGAHESKPAARARNHMRDVVVLALDRITLRNHVSSDFVSQKRWVSAKPIAMLAASADEHQLGHVLSKNNNELIVEDPTDFDLSPAMSLLMHDLHNVLGRHLQVYRVDESGLDSFEKTILLVVSFFSILQTLTSACDKFHWSEFPTFVTFVKHGSTMMAQYAGALSLRDWTWLHHLGLESSQSEVDKENAQLKSEMQRGFAASHLRRLGTSLATHPTSETLSCRVEELHDIKIQQVREAEAQATNNT
ncbi:unnamed protein product, partial [Cladocopium goreaui]